MKTVIKAENISKCYKLGKKSFGDLRSTLSNLFNKEENQSKNNEFWALKDVSFEIQEGDVVGLVGKNGAGKSTLLKVLSKITEPTAGKAYIQGRVASLLEVGTGFHPELTGKENIFLNGAILGMKRAEIKRKFDEIVAFSGIEKFIDTPVKRYSSGMYVRLAFAVAAHLEAEIMFIDEVLAVGDIEFQKKCLGKMGDVAKSGRTIIFVSHNMGAINALCNKGFYLKEGKLIATGSVQEISKLYFEDFKSEINSSKINIENIPDIPVKILSAEIISHNKNLIDKFILDVYEPFSIKLKVEVNKNVDNFCLMIHCNNEMGRLFSIFETNIYPKNLEEREVGLFEHIIKIPNPILKEGFYTFDIEVGRFGVGIQQIIKNIFPIEVLLLSKNPRFDPFSKSRNSIFALQTEWLINKLN